jgi:hypothetical protein
MGIGMTDFNSCSPRIGIPRLEYLKLSEIYPSTEALKSAIVTVIWNDDRLLREDIEDIAKELLMELRGV